MFRFVMFKSWHGSSNSNLTTYQVTALHRYQYCETSSYHLSSHIYLAIKFFIVRNGHLDMRVSNIETRFNNIRLSFAWSTLITS